MVGTRTRMIALGGSYITPVPASATSESIRVENPDHNHGVNLGFRVVQFPGRSTQRGIQLLVRGGSIDPTITDNELVCLPTETSHGVGFRVCLKRSPR